MCFSAEADLVAGAVVSAVGLDALRHARRPSEVPLAALPLVLGAHLLVEVPVWWALERDPGAGPTVWEWAYLLVAFVVVPVLAPLAVALWEPPATRARLWPFVALGAAAAVVLLAWQVTDPAAARIEGHHIEYVVRTGVPSGLVAAAYIVAACGPALLSWDPAVRAFGVANALAVGALAALEREGLVSLWCAWAAVASVLVAVRLRRAGRAQPASTAANAGG